MKKHHAAESKIACPVYTNSERCSPEGRRISEEGQCSYTAILVHDTAPYEPSEIIGIIIDDS